jgi:DNA-binding MarR family transcriptional regulator
MNNKDHTILEFLYPAGKKFSFDEIAKANLMARSTLSKHLVDLYEEGLVGTEASLFKTDEPHKSRSLRVVYFLSERGRQNLSEAKGYNNLNLLDPFEDSVYDEPNLLKLEKKIIDENEDYKNMAPKPIMIADSDSFDARTTDDAILISKNFLQKNPTVTEVNNLLKRELLKNVRR